MTKESGVEVEVRDLIQSAVIISNLGSAAAVIEYLDALIAVVGAASDKRTDIA